MLDAPGKDQCRYLIGDRPAWHWCRREALAGRPYCAEHDRLCHRQPGADETDAVLERIEEP